MNKTFLMYHSKQLATVLGIGLLGLAAYYFVSLYFFMLPMAGGRREMVKIMFSSAVLIMYFNLLIAFSEQRIHLNQAKSPLLRFWLTKPLVRKDYILLKVADAFVYTAVCVTIMIILLKFAGTYESVKIFNYVCFLMSLSLLSVGFSLMVDSSIWAFIPIIYLGVPISKMMEGGNLSPLIMLCGTIVFFIVAAIVFLRKDLKK